jgi:hypothetical protein
MTTTKWLNREASMADELKPCPFCGCAMRISAVARDWWRLDGDHDADCMLRSSETDVPQTPDQLEALRADWNRRTTPLPASGEPEVPEPRLYVGKDSLDDPINEDDDAMLAFQRAEDVHPLDGGAAPLYTAAQLRAYGDARAEHALENAYSAMFGVKGCKATLFDAQTAIRGPGRQIKGGVMDKENDVTDQFLIAHCGHTRRDCEHVCWWKPDSCGYTICVDKAGRYSADEARRICDVSECIAVPAAAAISLARSTPYYRKSDGTLGKWYDGGPYRPVENSRKSWSQLKQSALVVGRYAKTTPIAPSKARVIYLDPAVEAAL